MCVCESLHCAGSCSFDLPPAAQQFGTNRGFGVHASVAHHELHEGARVDHTASPTVEHLLASLVGDKDTVSFRIPGANPSLQLLGHFALDVAQSAWVDHYDLTESKVPRMNKVAF